MENASGRKAFNAVLVLKTLVLQHLYYFSGEELTFRIRNRYNFLPIFGTRTPDAKTIWLFRLNLPRLKYTILSYFFELLGENSVSEVGADSAYCSEEQEGYSYRHRQISKRTQQNSRKRSRIRACVEHVFGCD